MIRYPYPSDKCQNFNARAGTWKCADIINRLLSNDCLAVTRGGGPRGKPGIPLPPRPVHSPGNNSALGSARANGVLTVCWLCANGVLAVCWLCAGCVLAVC